MTDLQEQIKTLQKMSQHCGVQFSLGRCAAAQGVSQNMKSIASPEDARRIESFRFVALERGKDTWRDGSTVPVATTRDTYRKDISTPMNAPAWDVMEHKVLRFFSYFNEHVDESRAENYRSRPCEILYYLEDDTLEIIEPKIDNSGMNSGSLIKRHRFPSAADPEKLVSPADLRVGTPFTAYGKTFAITACDAFTREWYRVSGMNQPSNCTVDLPGSAGYSCRMMQNKHHTQKAAPNPYNQCIDDFFERVESPEPVCRFRAFFDDDFTNVIERRMYTILYFPRDDTLEIRENLPPLGGNRFTIFISRRKLLKGDALSVGPSYPRPPEATYFKLLDFKVGSAVTIADREFFIYGADPFTMSYVKDTLGIELQEPINIGVCEMPSQPSTSAKRRSRKEASPVSSKRDRKGGPLFVKATIADMICPDAFGREVYILFYPEEKYVSVFEPKVDGQSKTGGEKLLQKSVYFNEDAGRPFDAGDFVVGSTVTINRQTFRITSVSDLSGRPSQEGDFEPDQARVLLHLRRLWDGLRGNDIKAGQMFTACDERRKGYLTFQDFQNALERFGYSISEQDALLMSRYFDTTGDGKVDYEEFCKGMLELQGVFLSKSQRLNETVHSNIQAYRETAKLESMKLEDTKAIKQSFKKLQARLYQQPRLLQLLIKEFSRSSLGRKVSVDEAVGVFGRCGFEHSLEEIRWIVEELLPQAKDNVIDYIDLISVLKSTCRGV